MLEDYTRVIIVLRKINPKHLNESGLEYLKFQFYVYKFAYHSKEGQYRECKDSLIDAFEALRTFDKVEDLKNKVDNYIVLKYEFFFNRNNLAEAILSYLALQDFEINKSKEVEETLQQYDVYILENNSLK